MSGDFWGLGDDDLYTIPNNSTTVVDVSYPLQYSIFEALLNQILNSFLKMVEAI